MECPRSFFREGILAGRPAVLSSAQQVQMQVVHSLTSIVARVDDGAVPVHQPGLLGQRICRQQQVAQQRLILGGGVRKRADVFARQHQQMRRGLRMDVGNRHAKLIVVYMFRRNASVNDLAKEAAHNPPSVHLPSCHRQQDCSGNRNESTRNGTGKRPIT